MGFDLTIHWAQVLGTVGTMSATFGAGAFLITPILNRRAATREAGIKAGIREIVTEAITVSDLATKAQIDDVRSDVAEVKAKADATELTLATQFGGNGNGLREQLNNLAGTVAGLTGRFEQYVSGKAAPGG